MEYKRYTANHKDLSMLRKNLEELIIHREGLQCSLSSLPDVSKSALKSNCWSQCSQGGAFFRIGSKKNPTIGISESLPSSWILDRSEINTELDKTETKIRSTCVDIQFIINRAT
mmetsp:Transcript_40035/g.78225  ORF Transcript_40035/g.78225 Transcript_40035/m.78225 type:complete len:114 (-) Transcript_40035:9-350(-)